jgi:hypothetical protein
MLIYLHVDIWMVCLIDSAGIKEAGIVDLPEGVVVRFFEVAVGIGEEFVKDSGPLEDEHPVYGDYLCVVMRAAPDAGDDGE